MLRRHPARREMRCHIAPRSREILWLQSSGRFAAPDLEPASSGCTAGARTSIAASISAGRLKKLFQRASHIPEGTGERTLPSGGDLLEAETLEEPLAQHVEDRLGQPAKSVQEELGEPGHWLASPCVRPAEGGLGFNGCPVGSREENGRRVIQASIDGGEASHGGIECSGCSCA